MDDEEQLSLVELAAAAEAAPGIRLANALLLNLVKAPASLLRIEPSGRAEHRTDGVWANHARIPAKVAPAIVRRFKVMSQMPLQRAREPDRGVIRLRLGAGREEDFRLFIRPCPGGERGVVRQVPQSARASITTPYFEPLYPDGPLRWQAEHAFRLFRAEDPRRAVEPLRAIVRDAAALGPRASKLRIEAMRALAEVAVEQGDIDEASALRESAAADAEARWGRGLVVAAILVRETHILLDSERVAGAVDAAGRALELARAALTDEDFYIVRALEAHARALKHAGHTDSAVERYDDAVALVRALSGDDDGDLPRLRALRDECR